MKRLEVFLLPPGWDASPSQGYPHILFKITQLLSYLTTLDELRARCHAERRRSIFGAKLTAWRPKICHIFHFLLCDMVFEIVSHFLCIFHSISSEKRGLIDVRTTSGRLSRPLNADWSIQISRAPATQCPRPALEPGPLDLESSALTKRPP